MVANVVPDLSRRLVVVLAGLSSGNPFLLGGCRLVTPGIHHMVEEGFGE